MLASSIFNSNNTNIIYHLFIDNNWTCSTTPTLFRKPTGGGSEELDPFGSEHGLFGHIGFSIDTTSSVRWLRKANAQLANNKIKEGHKSTRKIWVSNLNTLLLFKEAERNRLCSFLETTTMLQFPSKTDWLTLPPSSSFKKKSIHKMIIETSDNLISCGFRVKMDPRIKAMNLFN
jgi:hypothetical protein